MTDPPDVFISFTHIDDKPLHEGQPGWVTEFHRHLQIRLNSLWGRESRIWRDPSLHGNDVLLPALERQLEKVKALVSVLSPRYVQSDWCQKEVAAFLKAAAAAGGMQVGDQLRWFKVLKTPLSPEDLPPDFPPQLAEYFQNVLGYSFFDIDPQSKRPREYSREFGPQAEQLYHAKVYDLAWDLCCLLKKLATTEQTPTPACAEPKTVFLAAGTGDVQPARDRIRRELLSRGHVVLGDLTGPFEAGALRTATESVLSQCDISIHVAGVLYGIVPEGTTASIAEIQNEIAAAKAAAGRLRRLIHIPEGTRADDPRQEAFLRRIREDEQTQAGAELIEGSIERLLEVLLSWVEPRPAVTNAPATADASRSGPPLVYLMGDKADMEAMDSIDDFLFNKGLEVTRPSFDAAEEEAIEAHRRRLVECDAALIYYGTTSREWVDMKLMDLAQARGYGRQTDYRAKAVCLAPPADRSKQRFRTRMAEVIPFDGQHPELLASLIEKLR